MCRWMCRGVCVCVWLCAEITLKHAYVCFLKNIVIFKKFTFSFSAGVLYLHIPINI